MHARIRLFIRSVGVPAALALSACGGGGGGGGEPNWYYHFICNGDSACLSTNFAGTPSGTSNQGPGQAGESGCNSLMTFGNINWNIPPAQQWCDHTSNFSNSPFPTVTISVSPSTVVQNENATITWSSTKATSCTASGAWTGAKGLSGNQVVSQADTGSYDYTLFCSNASGNATSTTTLTVEAQTAANPGTWATKASMPTGRYALAADVVDSILYAVGGYNGSSFLGTVEAYDTALNTWATKASMPTAQWAHAAGVVNGILYTVGGQSTIQNASVGTVQAYDPATNTWASKATMPTSRGYLAVGVVDGILYAVGGNDTNTGYKATVEAYDPATNTWATKASMPTARGNLAVGVVNGILYAVGGSGAIGGPVATVQAYDPATNTWTTKTPMPTARRWLSVSVVNGILYAVGGHDGNTTLTTVEAYDPATNAWTIMASMPTARSRLAAGTVNGILYAVGGDSLVTNEAFTP